MAYVPLAERVSRQNTFCRVSSQKKYMLWVLKGSTEALLMGTYDSLIVADFSGEKRNIPMHFVNTILAYLDLWLSIHFTRA